MYAIIENGGRQYKVTEGDVIDIALCTGGEGEKITFDKVKLMSDGDDTKIGTPDVAGASVTATILGTVKTPKVTGMIFRRRQGFKLKNGHRQKFTQVKITGIKA
ncbi:MAG: 50S ribosomal protein L21 [Planctomycetes bacterium]|nr:50S ribosomal protein L21 [Planctomycetota bacterium]